MNNTQNSQDKENGIKNNQQSQKKQNPQSQQQLQTSQTEQKQAGQTNQNVQQSKTSQKNQNVKKKQSSQSKQKVQQTQSDNQTNQNIQQSKTGQENQKVQQTQTDQTTQNEQQTQTSQSDQKAQQTIQSNQAKSNLLNTLKNQNSQNAEDTQINPNLLDTLKNQNTPSLLSTLKNQNTQSAQNNRNLLNTLKNQKTRNLLNTLKNQNAQSTPNTQTNRNLLNTLKNQNTQNLLNTLNTQKEESENQLPIPISPTLEINIENVKQRLGQPEDLVIRELTIGATENKCCIIHVSGITDLEVINNNILRALQHNTKQFNTNLLHNIYEEIIAISAANKVTMLDEIIDAILIGNAVFLLDGEITAIAMETAGGEQRSIDEPQIETAIRGSRIGFVENIATNVTLIRRTIKDPNLRFKMFDVGKRSKQKVVICYVEGIVNPEILDEVTRRIKTIDIDFATDSGIIEHWIEDSFISPFPQVLDTERPDRLVYSILEGKVAILVEGSPSALVAPVAFGETIHSVEDYSQRWIIGTLLRLLRYFSLFIALFLPAIYVALVAYHPGMLPTKIAFSIAAAREGVPFPSIIEALLMAITFEILQEAGIRLPKAIGQTIGIVGGIVIGDVAVTAGIVAPLMVIVTSLTAIASFTLPNYSMAFALRLMRFTLIIAASILGLYGIILVFIMMCIHLVNLKSMGIPYSAPFAPHFLGSLKDVLIRAPIAALKKRPPYLRTEDEKRLNNGGPTK